MITKTDPIPAPFWKVNAVVKYKNALARIMAQAAHVGELQARVKRRAMVYDADAKDQVAAYYAVQPVTLYDLPAKIWSHVWNGYQREIAAAQAARRQEHTDADQA